jgi:hypothetical protein
MVIDASDNIVVSGLEYYPDGSFVTKYDSNGNKLWDINISNSKIKIEDIATDRNENIYVAGEYADTVNFIGQQLISKGSDDMFLAKLDPAGNMIWIKSSGNVEADMLTSIAIDNYDNIYLTGAFFDSISFTTPTIISPGHDGFLAKVDTNGQFQLVKASSVITPAASVTGYDLTLDNNGNIFFLAAIDGSVKFDTTIISGSLSGQMLKFDTAGTFLWSVEITNGLYTGAWSLKATDDTIYVGKNLSSSKWLRKYNQSGTFLSQIPIGNYDAIFQSMESSVYISKYLGVNSYELRPVGCAAGASDYSVFPDHTGTQILAKNNIFYFAGEFYATEYVIGPDTLSSPSARSIYIAKYDGASLATNIPDISEGRLIVSPNPGTGIFQITYLPSTLEKLKLKVISSSGQTVYSEVIPPAGVMFSRTIDLSGYAKGVYTVEVTGSKKREVKKLVLN